MLLWVCNWKYVYRLVTGENSVRSSSFVYTISELEFDSFGSWTVRSRTWTSIDTFNWDEWKINFRIFHKHLYKYWFCHTEREPKCLAYRLNYVKNKLNKLEINDIIQMTWALVSFLRIIIFSWRNYSGKMSNISYLKQKITFFSPILVDELNWNMIICWFVFHFAIILIVIFIRFHWPTNNISTDGFYPKILITHSFVSVKNVWLIK